ncbi:MAG: hypothetical protein P0Y56_06035 [Candidatus Andeanibacterium colombiense]|uniref:Uncharacterized protein n=1 Tax=Candidatus Andeanibacterium colombiense TaxID=3121345 RepID=A0AAJ5X4Y5_9SPHN|nr:MAG: hypothetical protein P0Y56_06035 [Sphingomonadaceae bacterium]
MKTLLRRLETGNRHWAADIALRLTGVLLLGLFALAAMWLYRSVHQAPQHPARAGELLAGLVAVQGWCLGTSLLAVGQGLFELAPVPGRFPIDAKGISR